MRYDYASECVQRRELAMRSVIESMRRHFDRWVFLYFWSAYLLIAVAAVMCLAYMFGA